MKKNFIKYLLSICLVLPFAFLLTACDTGSSNKDVLNGYDIYINGTKTNEFVCNIGDEAITAEDVVVKSNWSNESKNAVVPLTDFDLSVKWLDQYSSEQTTIPNFWTTGSTSQDYTTTYTFTLAKDGISTNFTVKLTKKPIQNAKVCFTKNGETLSNIDIEWNHNNRHSSTPNNQYKLDIENLEANFNYENIHWICVEKDTYDSKNTPEEKKEYVKSINSVQSAESIFNNNPGTYYIFASVYSPTSVYGDNGYIFDYATLTISPASITQEVKSHISNYEETNTENISFYTLNVSEEIDMYGVDEVLIDCKQQVFDHGVWKTSTTETVKAHAIKDSNGNYQWVDLKDFDTNHTDWVYINDDGTQGESVSDTSKIEAVDYIKLAHYTNDKSITLPIYYTVADLSEHNYYFDYEKLFKTEATINKYLYTGDMPSINVGDHPNVIGLNTFEFTYKPVTEYSESPFAIINQAIDTFYKCYSLPEYESVSTLIEYSEDPYVLNISLNNPNFAWSKDGETYNSVPVELKYYIKKAVIDMPTYTVGEDDYDEYFANPIEIVWSEGCVDYKINNHITFDRSLVNVYRYKMTTDDYYLTKSTLADKIRYYGTLVTDYNENIVLSTDNTVDSMYVIMYDLQNKNSTVWNKGTNGTTQARLFKFKLIDGE